MLPQKSCNSRQSRIPKKAHSRILRQLDANHVQNPGKFRTKSSFKKTCFFIGFLKFDDKILVIKPLHFLSKEILRRQSWWSTEDDPLREARVTKRSSIMYSYTLFTFLNTTLDCVPQVHLSHEENTMRGQPSDITIASDSCGCPIKCPRQ